MELSSLVKSARQLDMKSNKVKKRGSYKEAKEIQHKKKIKALNKVLSTHIAEIQEKKISDFRKYCPECGSKLEKVENTYSGIPFLTVIYCPVCQYHLINETTE